MAISKLVKFSLEPRAIVLKNQRMSDYKIADILSSESGKKISRLNVHNYFRTQQKTLKALAAEDTEFHKEVLRQLLDANALLIFVGQKAQAAVERLEVDDPARVAPLLSVILHQVEILLKRAGEISDAPQITVINQRVEKFESTVIEILLEVGGEELKQKFFDAAKLRLRGAHGDDPR